MGEGRGGEGRHRVRETHRPYFLQRERLARWAERRSGERMVERWASFATRAVPFAGRTDAPSGHALQGTPEMRGRQHPWERPDNMRAEGPGDPPAKGNALVIGSSLPVHWPLQRVGDSEQENHGSHGRHG